MSMNLVIVWRRTPGCVLQQVCRVQRRTAGSWSTAHQIRYGLPARRIGRLRRSRRRPSCREYRCTGSPQTSADVPFRTPFLCSLLTILGLDESVGRPTRNTQPGNRISNRENPGGRDGGHRTPRRNRGWSQREVDRCQQTGCRRTTPRCALVHGRFRRLASTARRSRLAWRAPGRHRPAAA